MIPNFFRWVLLTLKQQWKSIYQWIQQEFPAGSIVRLLVNQTQTLLVLWVGSVLVLTILRLGLTSLNELVTRIHNLSIRIPIILFWLVIQLVKLIVVLIVKLVVLLVKLVVLLVQFILSFFIN